MPVDFSAVLQVLAAIGHWALVPTVRRRKDWDHSGIARAMTVAVMIHVARNNSWVSDMIVAVVAPASRIPAEVLRGTVGAHETVGT